MFTEIFDFLVWLVRVALLAGLSWGAWLAFGEAFLDDEVPAAEPDLKVKAHG